MKEKFLTRGNIALFIIAVAVTLITGLVCNLCGAERITTVLTAPMGGVLSILLVGALYEIVNQKAPMGPEAGILGVVFGTIISLIIF